jgi:hypothetical protein
VPTSRLFWVNFKNNGQLEVAKAKHFGIMGKRLALSTTSSPYHMSFSLHSEVQSGQFSLDL